MSAGTLSVVVAVQNAQPNLPDILGRLGCERHTDVDFLVCFTDSDPEVPRMLPALGNVRALPAPPGSLIPHLWRDGIRAAGNERVAVTTAHCVPADDWVERLLETPFEGLSGVGGVIDNDAGSDAVGWAIFFLRYAPYAPPQAARRVEEIAADNAVYRRDLIVHEADLLDEGFWEPAFHARFRAAGLPLALDPSVRVVHRNRYRAGQFFRQRLAHGRQFGRSRAARLPLSRRLALAILSPILPLVFLRKIVASARRSGAHRGRLLPALPWLCFFLLGWGLGEARGYWESLVKR